MWLALVICERCYLVQRDRVSRVEVTLFILDEYVCGCQRCGHPHARYVTV